MKVALFVIYHTCTGSTFTQGRWAGLGICNRVDVGGGGGGRGERKEEVVKVWWVKVGTLVVAQSSSFLIQ